jgi:succinate dehydrogenase hydrophobic anchor subunit
MANFMALQRASGIALLLLVFFTLVSLIYFSI